MDDTVKTMHAIIQHGDDDETLVRLYKLIRLLGCITIFNIANRLDNMNMDDHDELCGAISIIEKFCVED